MPTSKLQQQTYEALERAFPNLHIQQNHCAPWLIRECNGRLQLDIYIDSLGVAIEVQGEQHHRYVQYFHKTLDGLSAQIERDRNKREMCAASKVILFEVFEASQVPAIVELIRSFQDISFCFEYTPLQWARMRNAFIKQRCLPFKMQLSRLNQARFQEANRPLKYRDVALISQLSKQIKLLAKAKDAVKHDAVMEFAARFQSFYALKASEANYGEVLPEPQPTPWRGVGISKAKQKSMARFQEWKARKQARKAASEAGLEK